MAAVIIDGKQIAAKVREEVRLEVEQLQARQKQPGLAVILAGDDPASAIYVNNKAKACESCGIRSDKHLLSGDVSREELLELVRRLNDDPSVNGILCQLPLPRHLDEKEVLHAIAPEKDVDMLHPFNIGMLAAGENELAPCTPSGVMRLLAEYGITVDGKNCVVIGRSILVGKPMQMLLTKANGTVTLCHTHTKDLADVSRRADILVAAAGVPRLITADMVKEGAAVIDVGIHRTPNGLCGDVDYEAVAQKAGYITPVPGGCGPMTVAMLMYNTLQAAKLQWNG